MIYLDLEKEAETLSLVYKEYWTKQKKLFYKQEWN